MGCEGYMRRALELAARAEGFTAPNPLVGAVIVKDGHIIGEGYHHKAGEAHAEINALRMAGREAEGAELYVTLEPCCHYGRTPPCSEAIIKAGIRKVYAALRDPNPRVAGGGVAALRASGIEVELGMCEAEARRQNEVFLTNMKEERVFVALKAAASLDGRTASSGGESKWITGEEARAYVHRLRHRYDALITGIGTVRADDPEMTVRLPGEWKNPVRIVLDESLSIDPAAKILDTRTAPVWLVCAEEDAERASLLREKGVEVFSCPGPDGLIDLSRLLELLFERGLRSALVEAGAGLAGAFLDAELVDKLYLFLAPKLLGGDAAPGIWGGQGRPHLAEALRLSALQTEMVGEDLLISAYPQKGE